MDELLDDVKNWYGDNKRKVIIFGSIVAGVMLMLGIYYWLFNKPDKFLPSPIESIRLDSVLETTQTHKWFVDVKGEVKHTGVYEVSEGMRIRDVIELAGGFNEHADKNSINLSQNVSDEMVIFVPSLSSDSNGLTLTYDSSKIRLNTATKEELMTIDGVGEKKAEAIIAFRNKVKKIKHFDDLKEIKGFSQKLIDKIKAVCLL